MGRAYSRSAWVPALDVRETEDLFEVTVDLPGMAPEDVSVTYEAGVLTVSGTRQFSREETKETYHRIERSYGTFARQIKLPRTADTERIEASFDRGVLSVMVPKAEAANAAHDRGQGDVTDDRDDREHEAPVSSRSPTSAGSRRSSPRKGRP